MATVKLNPPTKVVTLVVSKQGPPGIDGIGVDANYVHNQNVPASVWNITHGLEKYCSITPVDSAGDEVVGDIHYVDLNNVVLTFSAAFSGQAFCN